MIAWITYSRFKINPLKEHQRWKRKYPLFHPLALHTRRVVHRVFTNNRVPTSSTLVSFHRTRRESSRKQTLIRRRTPPLIPRAGHLFLFPCLHAAREQHGLAPLLFDLLESKEKSTHPVCASTRAVVIRFQRGGSFSFFSSFFLLRRSNGMERRRGLEWKRDATKTKRRTFNERARDGVADRPRLNRADSEHVGLEWAWLSDGDGRSGSERDGQRSAGGWSGLVKWG